MWESIYQLPPVCSPTRARTRCVPWPGTKPTISWCLGWCFNQLRHPTRANIYSSQCYHAILLPTGSPTLVLFSFRCNEGQLPIYLKCTHKHTHAKLIFVYSTVPIFMSDYPKHTVQISSKPTQLFPVMWWQASWQKLNFTSVDCEGFSVACC